MVFNFFAVNFKLVVLVHEVALALLYDRRDVVTLLSAAFFPRNGSVDDLTDDCNTCVDIKMAAKARSFFTLWKRVLTFVIEEDTDAV